jgi:PAS domain S-box-containing protein
MTTAALKVLAIDDNANNLAALEAVLQDALPEVSLLTALNGPKGLELAQSEDPDVILLDIHRPSMDGYTLCQKLKEDELLKLIPIVSLTARKPDRESRSQALEAGAEAFLAMPPDDVELTVQIRAMAKIKAANRMQRFRAEQLSALVAERTRELENSQIAAFKLVQDLKAENEARRKSEDALRESEVKYHHLFEMVPDAIFLIDNETGNILDANRAATLLYGYSHEELLRLRNVDLSCQPAETQSAAANKIIKIPLRLHRKKDGSIFPVEITATHFLYNGRPAHMPAIGDITERLQTEERLISSEKEFRQLAEAMPQIVWITREDGWNIYFNQQWVDYTGLTLEESYGHGWNKPFHPDDQQVAWNAWQNAVTNNGTYSLECRLRRKDGNYRWWLIRGIPVMDERGKINKWFGTCTDIEEFKQAETKIKEQLEELRRWYDAMLGREGRILELKGEINNLLEQMGQPIRYPSATGMPIVEL